MRPFRNTIAYGFILNLLLPGLGHFAWKERLFAIFIFLIMLIAAILAVTSLLVPLPPGLIYILLGLPIVFYIFSFVDLAKTIRKHRPTFNLTPSVARVVLGVGMLYQLIAPTAIGNFALRNRPSLYVVADNHLQPILPKGTVVTAWSLSYYYNIPFMKRPILHALPNRGDVIHFTATDGSHLSGICIGLPGEVISVDSGLVFINGAPTAEQLPRGLDAGDWPLTAVSERSILVATFRYGRVDHAFEVELSGREEKVRRLF